MNTVKRESNDKNPLGMEPFETADMTMSINNLNVTLKFAKKPNSNVQENVLQVLVSSYKSRIKAQ